MPCDIARVPTHQRLSSSQLTTYCKHCVMPRLLQDTCCPETCIPDEQLVSGDTYPSTHIYCKTRNFCVHLIFANRVKSRNFYTRKLKLCASPKSHLHRIPEFPQILLALKCKQYCRVSITRFCLDFSTFSTS